MELRNGRPGDFESRLPKEQRVYELLDSLGIDYQRVDHEPAMTMEACIAVDEMLGATMCKNLMLCNRQQTDFYILLMPGSLSILGLMNDHDNRVKLLIDADVLTGEYIGVHPCINTSSLRIRTADLTEKLIPALGHAPTMVAL